MLFCIYRRHLLLLLRLLSLPLLSLLRIFDQVGHTIMSTPPYPSHPPVHDQEMHILNSKIMIVAVSSLLVITSLVMLLHMYAKWWFVRNSRRTRLPIPDLHTLSQLQQITSIVSIDDTDAINGLDSSIVAALPSFIYKLDGQKNRVECVVCLSVLEENDKGRILPKCQHVFHADCIDKWLVLHSTCPICRVVVMGPDESMAASMVHDVGPRQSQTSVVEPLDGYDGVDVAVEMPVDSRSENQASKDSFSSSSAAAASASLSVSLRRMLSRSRLECRVFPSDHGNDV